MSDEEEEMTVGDADSANNNSGGCFSCCGGKDKKPKKKSDMLPKPDTSIQKKEAEVEHTTVKNSLDSNSPPYSKQASTPPPHPARSAQRDVYVEARANGTLKPQPDGRQSERRSTSSRAKDNLANSTQSEIQEEDHCTGAWFDGYKSPQNNTRL